MISNNYELLKKIEIRPGMYIWSNKLKDLSLFLTGYNSALYDNNLIDIPDSPDYFHDRVAKKYWFYASTAGWENMILSVTIWLIPGKITWNSFLEIDITKEQHKQSMDKFYELLEDFISDDREQNLKEELKQRKESKRH